MNASNVISAPVTVSASIHPVSEIRIAQTSRPIPRTADTVAMNVHILIAHQEVAILNTPWLVMVPASGKTMILMTVDDAILSVQ